MCGERVDLEQVLREHPDIAPALRRRFAALAAVERALAPRAAAEETSAGGGSAQPSSAVAGRTIGGYRLVRELGRGGQASVWLAEDRGLARHVALKLLEPGLLPSPQSHARFRREAEAAARLDHPDVCAVYAAGVEGDTPYIAMRHVEGRTLAEWIDAAADANGGTGRQRVVELPEVPYGASGPTPLLRVVAFVERVARALHAAHEAGLVHRDVKPGNVMVTRDGAPVLLDFGLVRDDAAGHTMTLSGTLVGTPAYMAPEQLLGGGARADRRTDVYALGVTLYECLTLRRPFEAPTRDALYQQIISCDATPPRRTNPDVPRDLERVVRTAMEKDSACRYATALALAEDLRRVRVGDLVRARPTSAVLRLRNWTRRRPALAAALLAAVATAAVLTGFRQPTAAAPLAPGPRGEEPRDRRAHALTAASGEAAATAADGTCAVLLAREAVRLGPSSDALRQLRAALALPRRRALLTNHEGFVVAGEFNAAGDRVVTASYDGMAAVWDAASGERLAVLTDHAQGVIGARFLPDGRRVATASLDGTAALWDDTGKLVGRLRGHQGPVISVVASPQGDRVVTGSHDNTARLWDLEGRELARLVGHTDQLRDARFSTDGSRVVTASADGTGKVWDAVSGELLHTVGRGGGPSDRIRLSPRGNLIVAGYADGTVHVWDVVSGSETAALPLGAGQVGVTGCAAGLVAGWTDDGVVVRVWEPDGTPFAELRKPRERIHSVDVSADRERILTAGSGKSVRLWDHDGNPLAVLTGHTATIRSACFSPQGDRILSVSEDSNACIWDVPPGRLHAGPGADGAPDVRDEDLLAWTDALALRDFTREERERYSDALGADNPVVLSAWRALDRLAPGTVLVDELTERVKADTSLREDVRAAALRLAAGRRDDRRAVRREAWRVACAGRPDDDHGLALRRAEVAAALAPEVVDATSVLGAAQYRVGRYADALQSLVRADALYSARASERADTLAFLAMTHRRLGNDLEARDCLARARDVCARSKHPPTPEEEALLAEADLVVGAG